MPFEALTICGKAQIRKVTKRFAATHLLSLVDPGDRVATPHRIDRRHHFSITFDDVDDPDDPYAPTADHVRRIIAWVDGLPVETRLVVHCTAGVSRSTAVAYGLLCRTMPPKDAITEVLAIRPQASPNALLTSLWDREVDAGGTLHETAFAVRRQYLSGLEP